MMKTLLILAAFLLVFGVAAAQEAETSGDQAPANVATDYTMAKIAYQRAVEKDPLDAYSWSQLGRLYYWDREWKGALNAFEHYLVLVPGDMDVEVARARTLYNMRSYAESADAFYDLINREDLTEPLRAQALAGYALSLDRCGASEAACYWFEQALEANPDDIELRIAFATNLSGQKQNEAAFYQLNTILEQEPENEAALVAIARIYGWMGDYKQALCFLDKIDCNGPYNCDAILARSYVYYYMGELSKAYDEIRRYQGNCDPRNPDAGTLYSLLTDVEPPSVEQTWKQWEDSDDNDYTGWTTTLDYPLKANGEKFQIIYEDMSMDNTVQGVKTAATRTQFNYVWPVDSHLKLTARAWYTEADNNLTNRKDRWNIAPSFDYKVNQDWYVYGSYANYYMLDTAVLAANGVTVEEYSLGSRKTLFGNDNTWIDAMFTRGEYSDNNKRNELLVDVYRDLHIRDEGILRAGISSKYMDFAKNTNSGYFDPDKYAFSEAYLDWRDTSDRTLKWEAAVGYGAEKAVGLPTLAVLRYKAGLYTDFPESPVTLRAGYYHSDAATNQGGTGGYNIKQWYLTADVEF